jgi:hypothetical protein
MDSTRFGENGMNKVATIDGGGFYSESATKSTGGVGRPSRELVEEAVSTLIRWSGDDPEPEGLIATPARVARAYEEWFSDMTRTPRISERLLLFCVANSIAPSKRPRSGEGWCGGIDRGRCSLGKERQDYTIFRTTYKITAWCRKLRN